VRITRLYSRASSRSVLALAVLAALACGGCGWLSRVFDPVQDPGHLVALEPKFSTLQPGQSIELQASVADGTGGTAEFSFTEDSDGRVIQLAVQDPQHVLVTAIAAGQATVTASSGGDEGIAVITVVPER
jgi:hypothetical protein